MSSALSVRLRLYGEHVFSFQDVDVTQQVSSIFSRLPEGAVRPAVPLLTFSGGRQLDHSASWASIHIDDQAISVDVLSGNCPSWQMLTKQLAVMLQQLQLQPTVGSDGPLEVDQVAVVDVCFGAMQQVASFCHTPDYSSHWLNSSRELCSSGALQEAARLVNFAATLPDGLHRRKIMESCDNFFNAVMEGTKQLLSKANWKNLGGDKVSIDAVLEAPLAINLALDNQTKHTKQLWLKLSTFCLESAAEYSKANDLMPASCEQLGQLAVRLLEDVLQDVCTCLTAHTSQLLSRTPSSPPPGHLAPLQPLAPCILILTLLTAPSRCGPMPSPSTPNIPSPSTTPASVNPLVPDHVRHISSHLDSVVGAAVTLVQDYWEAVEGWVEFCSRMVRGRSVLEKPWEDQLEAASSFLPTSLASRHTVQELLLTLLAAAGCCSAPIANAASLLLQRPALAWSVRDSHLHPSGAMGQILNLCPLIALHPLHPALSTMYLRSLFTPFNSPPPPRNQPPPQSRATLSYALSIQLATYHPASAPSPASPSPVRRPPSRQTRHLDSPAGVERPQQDYRREAATVKVKRSEVLLTSVESVMALSPEQMEAGVKVDFAGEKGHGRGVDKEWFSLVSIELFAPTAALFTQCPANQAVVHPRADSSIHQQHLRLFEFAGRFAGLALRTGVKLGVHFSSSFFKALAGQPIKLDDLAEVDPETHQSLSRILSDPGVDAWGLSFVTSWDFFGQSCEEELVPGGANVGVDDSNKQHFVELAVQQQLVKRILPQINAFRAGLMAVADPTKFPSDPPATSLWPLGLALAPVNAGVWNLEMGGELTPLSVVEWRQHTRIVGDATSKVVQNFWKMVASMTPNQCRGLLQFWTGCTHLPPGGFAAWQATPQLLLSKPERTSDQRFPRAQTCFMQLQLPQYSSYEVMCAKFWEALHSAGDSGFQFL